MLHKCANPACSTPFLRLTEGKLFQVELESADLLRFRTAAPKRRGGLLHHEHYWLCGDCSTFLTLGFEKGLGVLTVPLPDTAAKKPTSSAEQSVRQLPNQLRVGQRRIER